MIIKDKISIFLLSAGIFQCFFFHSYSPFEKKRRARCIGNPGTLQPVSTRNVVISDSLSFVSCAVEVVVAQ